MLYEFQHFNISGYTKKEYGKNFSFPLHLHNAFEFITVLSGEMTITVDNKPYLLKQGNSLLVFPNQLHSFASVSSTHMLYIFSPDLIKTYFNKISGFIPQNNMFSPDKNIIYTLDNLCENASVIEKKGALYSLCAQFDKEASYTVGTNDKKNILSKIFKFVEQNYGNECSLYALSNETGYSYSYLSRYFKKITGISFNSYVTQYRISNACYLLSGTDFSILQCALESGYTSLRSFNRNFKEQLLITPNEYRKKFCTLPHCL